MSCETYRNALSARIDGEPIGMAERELDAHLATCTICQDWAARAEALSRRFRLAPAEVISDQSTRVVAALPVVVPARRHQRRLPVMRGALAFLAAAQLALTLWAGMAGGLFATPLHVDREASAWNLALAAGLFAVAWQVRLAAGVLPLLGAAVVVMALFETLDLARGHSRLTSLVPHLLLVVAFVLVTLLTRAAQPPGGRGMESQADARAWAGNPGRGGMPEQATPARGPTALMTRSAA